MMNHFLSPKREMVEKNGSIHKDNCYNQISINYQSLSEAPHDMQQRSMNYPHLINFMQGRYQEKKNVEDVKSEFMVSYASSSNNINASSLPTTTRYGQVLPLALSNAPPQKNGYHNIHLFSPSLQIDSIQNFMQEKYQQNNLVEVQTQSMAAYGSSSRNTTNASLMAGTGYGKMLPLAFPSAPLEQTGYSNIDLLSPPSHSNKNFSFNGVGLKGQISGFPSHPHGASFLYPNHQRNNNPFMLFNYSNPSSRVDTNSFHGMKGIAKPSFVAPIQVQHLDILSPKDLTRERAMKRPLCGFEDIEMIASASKRPRMSFTSANYYAEKHCGLKELLHLKDGEYPVSTFKITTHAKENTDKNKLDLSLHI